ncbi:hypothetical protein N309_06875, partial [Tinamus guttatus]
ESSGQTCTTSSFSEPLSSFPHSSIRFSFSWIFSSSSSSSSSPKVCSCIVVKVRDRAATCAARPDVKVKSV